MQEERAWELPAPIDSSDFQAMSWQRLASGAACHMCEQVCVTQENDVTLGSTEDRTA